MDYSPSDHSYSNLLISISPDISSTESTTVLENIKDWTTLGSAALNKTTIGWAYIKTVKILIPTNWKDVADVHEAIFEIYDDAEIRVEFDNSIYRNSPFTSFSHHTMIQLLHLAHLDSCLSMNGQNCCTECLQSMVTPVTQCIQCSIISNSGQIIGRQTNVIKGRVTDI